MRERRQRLLSRPWIRRTLPAGVAAIMVVGGTAVVRNNASASPGETYRTTRVTTGSVEQRLNLTGSAKRVNQVSQDFAVTGTVSSLSVAVGDSVRAGETLATLDPLPLRRAVTSAAATLAKAKATLESDQTTTATGTSGTNGTTGTTGTTGSTGTTAGTTGPTGTSGGTAAAPAPTPVATATPTTTPRAGSPSGRAGAGTTLAQAQRRVTSAQRAITADLQRASAALARCVPFFPSASSPSPTASSTPSATTTSTAGPTPSSPVTPTVAATALAATTTTTPSDAEIKACVGALRTAPTRQQIQRHQRELTDSQSAFMATVTLALTTTTSTPGTTGSSAQTGQTTTSRASASQSATNQSSSTQSSSTQSAGTQPSASQSSGGPAVGTGQSSVSRTISDQAAVTNAAAALSSARADLTAATLKSSIAGTVGSVSLVDGASSQGKNVVIVGTGAVEVTVDVPLASIASVHVGQQASVTPQGATSSAAGSVTSISLLPSTSSSSTGTGSGAGQTTSTTSSATYPVVVLVPQALLALASGSRADVSVLIGTAGKVLTVPNSALTPVANGQAMVLTLKNGVATRALVKTGYAGTLTTQVTSGLSAGQQVVLADLSTALPTNTTSSRHLGLAGGSGGLAGVGFGGAGLGGGTTVGGAGFPPAGFPPAG